MPWIQNVSMSDIKRGLHFDPGVNAMLIQIVDPAYEFPEPLYKFKEVHKFEFLVFKQIEIKNNVNEKCTYLIKYQIKNIPNIGKIKAHNKCKLLKYVNSIEAIVVIDQSL
jgi:hypothetical protein